MTLGRDDKRRAADPDDLPPTGAEARAQRRATSAPLLWFILGLLLIAIFVFVMNHGGGLFHAKAAGPAPIRAKAASSL